MPKGNEPDWYTFGFSPMQRYDLHPRCECHACTQTRTPYGGGAAAALEFYNPYNQVPLAEHFRKAGITQESSESAVAVALAERERCAKIAESVGRELLDAGVVAPQSFRETPRIIAARIRGGKEDRR